MDLVYLDYNCFQRGFDDHTQIKIRLEALACQVIFKKAEIGNITLPWSFMHEDETLLCPFLERKHEVLRLSAVCNVKIYPEEEILEIAQFFQKKNRVSSKDALHVACAVYSKSGFFITCDDRLLKQAKLLKLPLTVMNPVDYIRENRK